MNVCMITSYFLPTIGGVENHVYNLAKGMMKLGHNVVVVHTCFDFEDHDKHSCTEVVDGITTYRLYLGVNENTINIKAFPELSGYINGFVRKTLPITQYKKIYKFVMKLDEEYHFDIVHQHDFISNLFTTKAIAKHIPVVLTNHTGEYLLLNRHVVTRAMLPFLLNHISYMIGPSKELCEAPFLENKKKVTYIANGVDINEFVPLNLNDELQLRNDMHYSSDLKIVLCARRWAPTKGVIYLVKSIKHVIEKCPNVKFLISGNDYYGYPEYRNEILQYIADNGIGQYIDLLGDIPHDEIKRYYQVSDVVVLPSILEATSLAGLEAMSCGKPVIGTDVGGIPEIIENGVNGSLVPPKNEIALAEEIISLLQDTEGTKLKGINARNIVEQRFSWDIVSKKTESVYKIAIKNNKRINLG